MCLSDDHYIDRCLNGHPDDYRHLVDRHQGALLGYLRHQMKDDSAVQDAAQEAFVRAYLKLGQIRKRQSFLAWLIGIAWRVACDQRRRVHREQKMLANASHELNARNEHSPMSSEDVDAALEAAVQKLPENLRDLVLMRYYSGMSCGEVAQALQMPLGSVTKMLSRAHATLRLELEQTAGQHRNPEVRQ